MNTTLLRSAAFAVLGFTFSAAIAAAAPGTISAPALRLVFVPPVPRVPSAIQATPLRLVFASPASTAALRAAPLKLTFLPVAAPGTIAASPLRLVFVPGAVPQGAIQAPALRLIFQNPLWQCRLDMPAYPSNVRVDLANSVLKETAAVPQ